MGAVGLLAGGQVGRFLFDVVRSIQKEPREELCEFGHLKPSLWLQMLAVLLQSGNVFVLFFLKRKTTIKNDLIRLFYL